MTTLVRALLQAVVVSATAVWAYGSDIAFQTLHIQGISLEVETIAVTTGANIPTTVQTRFGAKKNEEAPVVEGLLAVGDLTGPGIDAPILLTTAPGHRFQIPGFAQHGLYQLQNIRLMKGNEFVLGASPSVATITVADLLKTEVTVRQLTPDQLRERGIVLDGRNFDVYEYSFSFLINGQRVEVPFPVVIDPRTHEVTPIRTESPFNLPNIGTIQPPRWTPPEIIPFELPPDPEAFEEEKNLDPRDRSVTTVRPRIPAALVIPNSLAVLHQFFGVILTISNGAPGGSTARLDDISATIRLPSPLRIAKSQPSVAFGQPVPIVDAANGVTFLVAQARGEAEWTLEGLAAGTYTVEIDVRATYLEQGQRPVRLQGTPRASIVVHDARFNINFSHPDTVRQGLDYSTWAFVTNTSAAQQTIRLSNGIPHCDQNPGANVCRVSGAESDEITLASGEMRMIEYRLRSSLTGSVFATAGTIGSENVTAAVQLHMGVSESGIPLSPATLILPHYAQFLSPSFVSAQLQLLGLGYSVATAPVTTTTAKFPRVIKTDVFYRAVDIARAGQKVFIADGSPATTFDSLASLALDLLGNGVELSEWDQLRREVASGRVAGAAMAAELNAAGMAGRSSIAEFVDGFAAATTHRKPFVAAIVHGPAVAGSRPYALALRSLSGAYANVPNEAESGWKRTLPFADISRFDVPSLGRAGEIGLVGRWAGDLEIIVTPSVSGPMALELILPETADGGLRVAHFDLTATAGEALRIPVTLGATTLQAILPNGGTAAVATTSPVARPQPRVVAARQDLHLDPEGHKVSVLFNHPIGPFEDLRSLFHPTIAFNRDGVVVAAPRPIFAAALQQARDIVNLSFDHVLSTNANYSIALDAQLSPSPTAVVPKIDNDRPAGILYGRFLTGDNTPIPDAEVRLYTGHFRGCQIGLFSDEPPPDCNPYRESPQYARTDASGTFLFESVPRDPIADFALNGGYRLLGVNPDGRFTIVNGAIRLPGSVHFVNLQLLGRGAAEGTVRYDNGEKVSGAEVYVGSTMFGVGRRAISDANGFFRIDDLPVGPITFSAKDTAGNVAFASGEIATPGHVTRKDVVIYRQPYPGTGTLFGVVQRSDSNSTVAGARVGVFVQGYAVGETFTDANGRYEFRRVPAGFVTVLAADWSIAIASASYDFDLGRDESRELPALVLTIRAENSEVAVIDGTITRADTLHPGGLPVAGAVVKLGDRPPLIADAQGRFRLDSIPLQWGNAVDLHAYDPETKRAGKIRLPALTLAGPNHVSVFLEGNAFGEGVIRVRVLDAHGYPVSGFTVLRPGSTPLPSVAQGVHEYRGAPVGMDVPLYAVNGPAAYGSQFAHGTARLDFPGQTATVTLRLPGDGMVRVRLRSDIDLIGDVTLRSSVWDDAEQTVVPRVVSASTGAGGIAEWATFQDVPALQQYTIESLHPVYGYATVRGQLAYDGDSVDHTLQLNRLSTVQGTVYAIDGVTPIAGASVRIEDGRRDPGAQLTSADGRYTFHDVPAATQFRIVADVTQSGIYRTGVAYGSTPPSGGPVEGIAVLLRPRGSVEGRVVYKDYKVFDRGNPANHVADDTPHTLADNAPVPLASFWLRELGFPSRMFGTNPSPLTTDAAGRFVIPNVFVGSLRARAWDSGNQELEATWIGEIGQEGEVVSAYIGVGDGGTGSIRITVVDPNQQLIPIPNAEVSLLAGMLFDLASTDGTGVALFQQVPAGTYSASAYSKALGKLGASSSFVVGRDEETEIRILLEFSGEVTGSLTDPESIPTGNPVAGAAVTLTGSNYQTRASTDIAGAFDFDGVREGSFALDAKDTRSNRRARATRALSAADPHPHVNLLLEPTETLHVAVYLPDDTGASSGVLAPPVEVTATQRGSEYLRTVQGNPAQLPAMFRNERYTVTVRELAGEGRTFRAADQQFPVGSSATPLTFVYRAQGTVEVLVQQGGVPANGARLRVNGGGKIIDLFTGPDGRALAYQIPLGPVAVQATSIDGTLSGSVSGTLTRSSVPVLLEVELGAYAGVTGLVEAEKGGPSIGTRVLATFAGRTLESHTDTDGRYTFHGIPALVSGSTSVQLAYVGPDEVTVGATQVVSITSSHASVVVTLPAVRLDATPPQLVSVTPDDGAVSVSPDTFLRFTFTESIRADQIDNTHFELVASDGSGQLFCTFDPPMLQPDGRVVITMRPPPAPPGQSFPLKSHTLYRIIVSGQIADLTGHRLPASRGQTFTTSDYAEPRVVKVVPSVTTPASRSQTFEFHFNEVIDPAPWQSGGGATFGFYQLASAGGAVVAEKSGSALVDPANAARLIFGPAEPLQPESFYRIVFSGVRDLQGNTLPPQTFDFFSFDETAPFVVFVSPVPAGAGLVSGVEYTLGVDLRNATASGALATDVVAVEWLRVDGTAETFLTTITKSPFGYRFVAPEAPAEGITFSLRARATDLSGNIGEPATISFTVKPNVAPSNVSIALVPEIAYPGNAVTSSTKFDDEGIVATLQVVVEAARIGGTVHSESKTRQVSRASVADPWPAAELLFTLPVDLHTDVPSKFTATVTDVRGLSASASRQLTLIADTVAPIVHALTPAAETRFQMNQQYRADAVVSDGETAVAYVDFGIDGQTHRVLTSTTGPAAGTRTFTSPLVTVPAKNVDTRVAIVATAADHHGNAASRVVEVIYAGVNDPAIPKAAWICPVDRASLPAATTLTLPLRVRATDDIAITAVRFHVPGLLEPVAAARVGTTDVWSASVALTTYAAGEPFVVRAEVSDADPAHTIELPIELDLIAVDVVVDATQAVTASTLAQFENKSVLVRSSAGRLVTHVPVTFANLLILDGGRVESLATTTSVEHRVDLTVIDRLYVDCDSRIDVSSKGYLGGWGVNPDGSNTRNESPLGRTIGNTTTGGASEAGASHGGLGQTVAGGTANETYGTLDQPMALGSGGAGAPTCCTAGGAGGGAITIRTSATTGSLGRVTVAGQLRADGGPAPHGGSGGSVFISAKQLILGDAAVIAANGGDAAQAAGGGGRIAITATERLEAATPFVQLQSRGGTRTGSGVASLAASPGTVLLRRPGQQHGELSVGNDPTSPPARSTPLWNAGVLTRALVFDSIHLGPQALARFDDELTTATTTIDSTAVLLLPSDRPIASMTTIPATGANLIRATDLEIAVDAVSRAGVAQSTMHLSVAPVRVETLAGYPPSLAARLTRITIPADAALGAATLNVRITDRADRFVDVPQLAFAVIENQPPVIGSFTAIPDALYPGKSVAATVTASDDVKVTKLSVTSQIGDGTPVAQSVTPNIATVTHSFNITVPITTSGGTPLTIEAAVEDGFPSRVATKQTSTITILTDTVPPSVTISEPAAGASFNESSGATLTVRAIAADAEVGVRTITAKAGNGLPVTMSLSGGTYVASVPIPNVDGVDPVPVTVTVVASDYEGNATTATVQIFVVPLNDPNAPAVRWSCGASGAMFAASTAAKLRVYAKGATTANGVQKVEFFIGFDATPLLAAAVSGLADHYETTWNVPDEPDGTTVDIRAVVTSVSGNQSEVLSTITIVKSGIPTITSNLTIDASNAATFAHQTVILQGGTVTIIGQQTFQRLVVLGGTMTHPAGGANALQLEVTGGAFVACGAALDVTGRGFPNNTSYPGAVQPYQWVGGSHIGASTFAKSGTTFGSVSRPAEAGGGAYTGSAGGGVVRLEAETLALEGGIRANGVDGGDRSGAGGSVWITAGRIAGSGTIEARGGNSHYEKGGGGAVAIEFTDSTSLVPAVIVRGGTTGTYHAGGPGTLYVRGPASTHGNLTIDSNDLESGVTELPALGRGMAVGGTGGSTLVTDHPSGISPFFQSHWVEITRNGALVGTWRIGTISSPAVTLVPNSGEAIALQVGDSWQGVYRFDTARVIGAGSLVSADPIRLADDGVMTLRGTGTAELRIITPVVAPSVIVEGKVSAGAITARDLKIESLAVLRHPAVPAGSTSGGLHLQVHNELLVRGSIDVTGRGFATNTSYPGALQPYQWVAGSHIGASTFAHAGSTFGSVYRPGEAGGGAYIGSAGGGIVRIEAGKVSLDGTIHANGVDGGDRSGAGGSVWITTGWIGGSGAIEARGGNAQFEKGGGGAVAIEYSAAESQMPVVIARGGTTGNYHAGGAGSLYVRGPTATYGALTIDANGLSSDYTDLAALGRGRAQAGTTGATLVTDRATDIPRYFEGHWVEITRGGALLGTWRVQSVSGPRSLRLSVAEGESIGLQEGDLWAGVYRFDSLTLRSARLRTEDQLRVSSPPDVGSGSSILGNNAGPPVVDSALIRIEERPTGLYLIGDAGAVTDVDAPITVIARNATGGVYSATVSANGSFTVQIFGGAGELITLSARDGNYYPLESVPVAVGALPASAGGTTQISRTSWTSDSAFRAQTVVAEGMLLAVASTHVNGAGSDKVVVLDTTNPAVPIHVRTIATGAGGIRDLAVVDGWAYVAANRLATVDLTTSNSTVNLAGVDPTGAEQSVAVSAGYAFTTVDASSGSIHIYDVSEPAAPRFLRTQTFASSEGVITDLIPYGTDYLVALMDGASIDVQVIDRRDVNNLARAGSLSIASFNARRGSILGSLLYAVSPGSSEVVVVDLSNPAAPAVAARLLLPASGAGHVRIAADFAFVANTTVGLTATTIDPSSFVVAGTAATTGSAQDVAVTAGVAYVANENGIVIIPVTTAPVVEAARVSLSRFGGEVTAAGGARSVTGTTTLSGTLRNVRSGDTAAVLLDGGGSVSATIPASGGDPLELSVTDAVHARTTRALGSAPFVRPEIDVRAIIAADNTFFARRLAVDGETTLLTGGTHLGARLSSSAATLLFRQPNATEPAQIVMAAAAGDEVNDSAARSGFGYLVGSRFSTINYLNTTPTTNTASSDPSGRQYAVALTGDYAFVAGDLGANGSIHVYDISTPTSPIFLRTQAMSKDAPMFYRALIPLGPDKIVAISPDAGRDVTILDVSNPSALTRVAVLDLPSFVAYRGTIEGTTLYLAGGDAGVAIVDLTNPTSPQHVSTIDTPGIAFAAASVDAGQIVVADGSRGLTFIDVSSRQHPIVLGSQPLRGNATDVKVVNGYIHVATETRYFVLRP